MEEAENTVEESKVQKLKAEREYSRFLAALGMTVWEVVGDEGRKKT